MEEAEGKEKLLYSVDQANSARVSVTHLSFTCDVFLEYLKSRGKENGFRFFYKETDGLTAIGDVSTGASELGVIHLHNGVLETAQREVDSKGLHLEKLSDTVPHLVVRVGHPLARLNRPIRAEDLYDQSFVIYPELDWMMKGGSSIHSQVERGMKNMDWSRVKKIVYVSSRGTFYNLVTQTNAVAVGDFCSCCGRSTMNKKEHKNTAVPVFGTAVFLRGDRGLSPCGRWPGGPCRPAPRG